MRLLLDQNLPLNSAGYLREMGHDAIHAGELGMATASDRDLLLFAVSEKRVNREHGQRLPPFDCDATHNPALYNSVARTGAGFRMVADRVQALSERFADELERGCLITSRAESVRVRMLPLIVGLLK